MIADKAVEQDCVENLSHVSAFNVKKNGLKPWKIVELVIPPAQNSGFAARMEQALDVCKCPCNADNPVACMDESPEQLIETVRQTELKPGREAREDYEYVGRGVANIFMTNEPLKCKRMVEVTASKTKADWAKFIARTADETYPNSSKTTLVMDGSRRMRLGHFMKSLSQKRQNG
jgi:hypothetical protein